MAWLPHIAKRWAVPRSYLRPPIRTDSIRASQIYHKSILKSKYPKLSFLSMFLLQWRHG